MANIAPRPAGKNFYGAWWAIQPGDSWNTTESTVDFDTGMKPQIDAAAAMGANFLSFFGTVELTGTLANYVGGRRRIIEYLAKKGMYALPYASYAIGAWFPSIISNDAFCDIMRADAAMLAQYPNCVGYVTTDEPWGSSSGEGGSIDDADLVGMLAQQYGNVRSVVPSNFGVCTAPNPCGNSAFPVFQYTGSHKVRADSVAAYNDFWCFHPFATTSLSDSSAIRAAYPDKPILMPSSVLSVEGAIDIATKSASIMGLVGASNFRGMAWFLCQDFDANTWGMFNSDLTERTAKTNAFRAGLPAGLNNRSHHITRGKPRLSNMTTWGY